MLAYSPPDARLTVNACRRRGGDPRRTWRFSGGSDSETGSGGGPMWRASERWRSGWDGEFESPLLQRRVSCEPGFLRQGAENFCSAACGSALASSSLSCNSNWSSEEVDIVGLLRRAADQIV